MLLFLHGGGYELGSVRSDGELAARIGRASGMRVLFPEYRLAPEHPFPAAIGDVLAAWRWLRDDQDLSARSLAVAGDPAGGGLAVALLVALRDAGEAAATEQIGKFLRARVPQPGGFPIRRVPSRRAPRARVRRSG